MRSALDVADREIARTEDATQFAYETLRNKILTGDLEPGASLSQVQLARDLGISRTPLREALRQLITEHLVTGDFNRRMRVSQLRLDDVDQIYAMRIALEPIGIRATVPFLDADAQAVLIGHVERMTEAIDNGDLIRFRIEHRAFHLGLTTGSGPRICNLLEDLWDQSERYRLAYLHHDYADRQSASAERLRVSQDEHRIMLQAAVAGDAPVCADALVGHLKRTVGALFTESTLLPHPRMAGLAARAAVSVPGLGG